MTLTGKATSVELTPTSEIGNQPVNTTSLPKKMTPDQRGQRNGQYTGITFRRNQCQRLCPNQHLRHERGIRCKLLYQGDLHTGGYGQANGKCFGQ